jgi:RsiW-degrading membrane proteinase PrsW (M82 family)
MNGLSVVLFLIAVSALPACLAILWLRLSRFPLSPLLCLCALLAGAAAIFPALMLQRLVSVLIAGSPDYPGRWEFLTDTFIRIALTEELSRLLALVVLFLMTGDFGKGGFRQNGLARTAAGGEGGGGSGTDAAVFFTPAASRGAALGLLAGFGFAIVESAAYGAADFRVVLIRVFTAAPIHGACGARIGPGILLVREQPLRSVFRFFAATFIHGIYNFLITGTGLSVLLAILIALSALASSVIEIRAGMKPA